MGRSELISESVAGITAEKTSFVEHIARAIVFHGGR